MVAKALTLHRAFETIALPNIDDAKDFAAPVAWIDRNCPNFRGRLYALFTPSVYVLRLQ
jgi:hypothetical protein